MNWIVLSVLAGLTFGVVELFDKFVLDNEVKDPFLSALFCKLPIFAIFAGVGFLFGNLSFDFGLIGVSLLLVAIYITSSYSYYSGIEREDVSRFIPTLTINGVFIVILSYLFLGEQFSPEIYSGVLLAIAGSFLISLDHPGERGLHNFQSRKAIYLAVAASLLWAVRDVALKFLTTELQIFSVLLWIGLIGVPVNLLLIRLYSSRLEEKDVSGYEHLMLIGSLVGAGYLIFLEAIETGPVSLVSVIVKLDAAFVFLGSAAATVIKPDDFHEDIDRRTLVQKTVALLMIFGGIAVINLF